MSLLVKRTRPGGCTEAPCEGVSGVTHWVTHRPVANPVGPAQIGIDPRKSVQIGAGRRREEPSGGRGHRFEPSGLVSGAISEKVFRETAEAAAGSRRPIPPGVLTEPPGARSPAGSFRSAGTGSNPGSSRAAAAAARDERGRDGRPRRGPCRAGPRPCSGWVDRREELHPVGCASCGRARIETHCAGPPFLTGPRTPASTASSTSP